MIVRHASTVTIRSLPRDLEVTAPVLRPTRFSRALAEGRLFPKTSYLNAIRPDSEACEVLPDRFRPSVAQRKVVFGSPALITMTIDTDHRLRPFGEPLHVLLQHPSCVFPQRVLVIVEEHVAEWMFRVELAQ